ncbi:MAG: GHKL domain-containing protein [Lachnospiraceae bacterium]|nr:GHKL domain-containing protein [Lachnospiraceae bacterium]
MERFLIIFLSIILFFILLFKWFHFFLECRLKGFRLILVISFYCLLCVAGRIISNRSFNIDSSFLTSAFEIVLDIIFIFLLFRGTIIKKIILYILITVFIPAAEISILSVLNGIIGLPDNLDIYENNTYINFFTVLILSYSIILIMEEYSRYKKYSAVNCFFSIIFLILMFQFMMHYYFSYISKISTDKNLFNKQQFVYAFSALIFFCICMMYEKSIAVYHQTLNMNHQLEYHKYQAKLYEDSGRNLKEIKKIRHDYKNHLITIKELLGQKEYLQVSSYITGLEESLNKTDSFIDAKNPVVSALLTYKRTVCQQNQIQFKYHLEYEDIPVAPIDLSIMLGNLLDNAIEACMKINPVSLRIIRFAMGCYDGHITIVCSNPYTELYPQTKTSSEDIKLLSSKSDKNNHGFGLINIQEITEKYNGKMDIQASDNVFTITLYLKQTKKQNVNQ